MCLFHSVFHLGVNAGQTRLCARKHLQCAAPHAQLHHGQQPTYASKCVSADSCIEKHFVPTWCVMLCDPEWNSEPRQDLNVSRPKINKSVS